MTPAQPAGPARRLAGLPSQERPSVALDLGDIVEAIAQRTAQLLADRDAAPGLRPPDGYLDVDAAAAYLACPRSRIYDLVSLGRLRPHRDGRRLLFTRADLDAALDPPEPS
mgnify:CR=1 FL=1